MSWAEEVLTEPRKPATHHRLRQMTESNLVEFWKVWRVVQANAHKQTFQQLGQLIRDNCPELDVQPKQVAVWLADDRLKEKHADLYREAE